MLLIKYYLQILQICRQDCFKLYPAGTKWLAFATNVEPGQTARRLYIMLADQLPSFSSIAIAENDIGLFPKKESGLFHLRN